MNTIPHAVRRPLLFVDLVALLILDGDLIVATKAEPFRSIWSEVRALAVEGVVSARRNDGVLWECDRLAALPTVDGGPARNVNVVVGWIGQLHPVADRVIVGDHLIDDDVSRRCRCHGHRRKTRHEHHGKWHSKLARTGTTFHGNFLLEKVS